MIAPREKNPMPGGRCPACQLQLCKSRYQPPHAALTEAPSTDVTAKDETDYVCQTCGATLTCAKDFAKPGWTQRRVQDSDQSASANERHA